MIFEKEDIQELMEGFSLWDIIIWILFIGILFWFIII